MAAIDDNLALSSESDAELDQVDLFHVTREKAMLELYGKEGRFSADDSSVGGDSETEAVMQLDLSTGEGDSHPDLWSSDEEAHGNGAVAVGGWGKPKTTYYTENGDGERDGLEQELEEREATELQQQQSALLSEGDFEADFSDSEKLSSDANMMDELNELHPKKTFPLMSPLHPELPNIIQHLQHSIKFLLRSVPHLDTSHPNQMKTLVETNVLLKFCHSLNSMFYLLLITHSIPVISHPVSGTLFQLQKLVDKMVTVNELAQRKRVLTPSASYQPRQRAHSRLPLEIKSSAFSKESPLSFYHRVDSEMWRKKKRKAKSEDGYAQQVRPLEGKRAITYQIARNKGIGKRTKRQLRNPRLKHKLKYKKALLKRKSQVLPVVMKMSKYGGETTGIKANLSRSTKINS